MGTQNSNELFYTCRLIEYIGRKAKRTRREVADFLGKEKIKRIYKYADVFHCEPIEKTAVEFMEESQITEGSFDNVGECGHACMSIWRLPQGSKTLRLFCMAFDDQSRGYIAECYREGVVL